MNKRAQRLTTLATGVVIGLGAVGAAWSNENLKEVMDRRGLTEKDLLAAQHRICDGGRAICGALARRRLRALGGVQRQVPRRSDLLELQQGERPGIGSALRMSSAVGLMLLLSVVLAAASLLRRKQLKSST